MQFQNVFSTFVKSAASIKIKTVNLAMDVFVQALPVSGWQLSVTFLLCHQPHEWKLQAAMPTIVIFKKSALSIDVQLRFVDWKWLGEICSTEMQQGENSILLQQMAIVYHTQ